MAFFDDSWGGCVCNLGTESGAFTGVHSLLCERIRDFVEQRVLCEREACARIAEQQRASFLMGDGVEHFEKIASILRERKYDEMEWMQWKIKKRKESNAL
jgi:hypothetical protein